MALLRFMARPERLTHSYSPCGPACGRSARLCRLSNATYSIGRAFESRSSLKNTKRPPDGGLSWVYGAPGAITRTFVLTLRAGLRPFCAATPLVERYLFDTSGVRITVLSLKKTKGHLMVAFHGFMARPERFERPTAWFVARYSIQLSYGRGEGALSMRYARTSSPGGSYKAVRSCVQPCPW